MIILTLFIEYFLERNQPIKWLLGVNDCLPEGKIPAELKQDESKHDSSQQKNAEGNHLDSGSSFNSLPNA